MKLVHPQREILKASGLTASSYLYFISKHFRSGLVVVPNSFDLNQAKETLNFFLGNEFSVSIFPSLERVYEPLRQEPEALFQRILTQWQLASGGNYRPDFILTTREALSQKTISAKEILKRTLKVEKGAWLERDHFIQQLFALGYRKDELAEDQGFFSVRGHLIDIFSPYENFPYRLEFFGDEVVSLRTFDPKSQRSLKDLENFDILPCRELILTGENLKLAKEKLKDLGDELGVDRSDRERILSELENHREIIEPRWVLPAFTDSFVNLFEYLDENLPIILVDAEKSAKDLRAFWKEEDAAFEELSGRLAYPPHLLRSEEDRFSKENINKLNTGVVGEGHSYEVLSFEGLRQKLLQAKSFLPLAELVREFHTKGIATEIILQNSKRTEALKDALPELQDLIYRDGPLFDGFSSNTFQKIFINEKDIFGSKRRKVSSARVSSEDFLRQFSDLKEGDYIIHEDHGIGRYRGLQKLEIHKVTSEFLVLEFADNDKLYLPIYRVDKLSRYVREGFAHPRLDKLGTQIFLKKKAKIRKDILAVAHELLEIAGARKTQKVERLDMQNRDAYFEFGNRFAYDLTSDQESAVAEIESDMRKDFPMDRLVCGDVGFGKTEVALRAAMRCLLQGRQVAVLAPTTILVEQHMRTFKKRFEGFKFHLAHLSRFVSDADQKKSVAGVREGKIDLVIGTHRLLQNDIQFKNLGLLIIDEEQRFGVKHKEKIKKMRSSIDILTLSATPIPRTLQMSIFGIRELSLITTPPESRESVKTYVGAFDENLIRAACLKERERGGQILFVHNRVQTIQGVADKLKKLLPECKIVVAHGQMKENDLENKMLEFIEGRADILIATTIIENGLDIPNANTLFVDHAEMFGLSDLYQLRGRVGRGHRSSFAYFLIHENTALSEEASKRLQVIQSCTELGSGFNVATHDMEIRGSGNLLGEEQSGIIAEVGLELYTQMLQETLSTLKKESFPEPLPELNSGYSAYIPETYIPDATVRIATYSRLNKTKTPGDLLILEEEILDRFGLYPKEVENLCQLQRLRTMAYALKASVIDCFPGKLSLTLSTNTPLEPQKIIPILSKKIVLDPKGRLVFHFDSALKKPELATDVRYQKHHELYDFSLCRDFLKDLCSRTNVVLQNI
ncbi:MAG: transcription-repair coupling factor [Deltaproteobacteria bacterium]|nr:transcription-repair coupling factor [Deltaproteobacteria bacterium]